jgi:UDP-GlcNAc:undecaprenyl-phosphate GlcNAc-1-phosphate transferase
MAGSIWLAVVYWWVVNAMNLLDHADGLAGSAASGSLAVAGGITGFAGVGACIGFLVHNFPPARAFLGDGGSMLLGALMVSTWSTHGPPSLALGVAVPMADLTFVALRRVLGGRKPWVGGTDHTGHILLRAGVPPRLLPLLYAGLAALVALLGSHGW